MEMTKTRALVSAVNAHVLQDGPGPNAFLLASESMP